MQSPLSPKPASCGDRLHVGIIMDGNGRWATRRGLSRLRGHEAGVEAIRRTVEAAPDQGVGTLTLYAFSTDNWRRPRAEVSALMGLLRFYLKAEIAGIDLAGLAYAFDEVLIVKSVDAYVGGAARIDAVESHACLPELGG